MLKLFALLAAIASAPPPENTTGEVHGAIWSDLQLNALIGNGNWLGSLWYNASRGDADTPDLHIRELTCRPKDSGYRCSFELFRDGGVVTVLEEEAPDRLRCKATFERQEGEAGLSMKHLPPPRGGGHSRTTMRCRRA